MKYIKDPKVIPRLYKVSQEGEVFKVHKGYMKRLNPYLFNIGIPSVSLKCKDGKFRFFKLSRLVAFAYVNYHGVSKVKLAKHFDISITTLRRVFLDDRWDFYYPKKLKLTKTKQKS